MALNIWHLKRENREGESSTIDVAWPDISKCDEQISGPEQMFVSFSSETWLIQRNPAFSTFPQFPAI